MTAKRDDLPAVPRRWVAANIFLAAILFGAACIAAAAIVLGAFRAGG